jgi:endogenous inhibitor of DNA gyrase (YacG/DUF329 family)
MKEWIVLDSRDCNICGKSYEYDSRQKKSKYCSQSCRSLSHSQNKISGIEGVDFVICKICGLKFKEINNDHIKKHNMSCEEYDDKFKSSRTSEKTRIKKDTLSKMMCEEMSNKLSKSHTIEGYIEKYGDIEGVTRFNKMISNKQYKNGKKSYIDKYGDVKGLEIYREVQNKKAITLKNCIEKHGLIEGENIYNKWRELQKNKNLLSYYINKYGYEIGLEKWLDKNNKISLSNSKIKKEDKKKFINYICDVNKYTRLSLSNNMINGIDMRGKEFGYDLDHIYSKVNGFRNEIPAYVIGHVSNLRIVESSYNRRKQHRSDIEIEEIIKEYENDIEYQKLVNDIEKIKNNG